MSKQRDPDESSPHTCVEGHDQCLACGRRDCPAGEPKHYHHDGCPVCGAVMGAAGKLAAQPQAPSVVSLHDDWKLVGVDEALEGVPAEERAALAAEIRDMFRDFDPADPPGQAVTRVAPGTRECPLCGGGLVEFAILAPKTEGSSLMRILDCENCDESFSEDLNEEVQ